VDFVVEQRIALSGAAAVDAFADPSFYAALGSVPNIGAPEVLTAEDDGTVARLAIRFRFTGDLAPAARRVLDPAKLTWVQQSVVDRTARRFDFTIVPDNYGDRLESSGRATFTEGSPTTERVEGRVTVHFPVVHRLVERAIVSGLTEHIAEQARVLVTYSA